MLESYQFAMFEYLKSSVFFLFLFLAIVVFFLYRFLKTYYVDLYCSTSQQSIYSHHLSLIYLLYVIFRIVIFFMFWMRGESMIMIFVCTCESTRLLALMLRNLGFKAMSISGQMSQIYFLWLKCHTQTTTWLFHLVG